MLDLNDIYLVCQLDYQSSTYRVCVNEMPFCHAEMCLSSIYLDLTPADVLWLYGMSPITEYRGGAGASVQCVPCPSRQDPCLLNGGVSQLPLAATEGVNRISW